MDIAHSLNIHSLKSTTQVNKVEIETTVRGVEDKERLLVRDLEDFTKIDSETNRFHFICVVSLQWRHALLKYGRPYLFADYLYTVENILLRYCAVGDYRTYSEVDRFLRSRKFLLTVGTFVLQWII